MHSTNFVRSVRFAVGLAAAACSCFTSAQTQKEPADAHFAWMRDFLAEFSIATISGAPVASREVLSTRLDPVAATGEASLVYVRSVYSGEAESSLQSRQIIHYTLSGAALDRDSVAVQPGQDTGRGGKFWPVTVKARGGTESIPYSNLVEVRRADGTVDVTSSRSRVRQVVLGYFSDESQAGLLAKAFREWLLNPAPAPKTPPPSGVTPATPAGRSSA